MRKYVGNSKNDNGSHKGFIRKGDTLYSIIAIEGDKVFWYECDYDVGYCQGTIDDNNIIVNIQAYTNVGEW